MRHDVPTSAIAAALKRLRNRIAGGMWIVVAILGLIDSDVALASGATDCPELAGHYRVDGFGPVLGDALEALDLRMAGFTDSEVKITGRAETGLDFWVKSGGSSPMSSRPSRNIRRGIDYDCANGAIVLKRTASSSRQSDEGWLEGHSTVRLTRAGIGLGLSTEFRGGQRSTLYSYDSARISVPKFGTSQTLGAAIRWPNISEAKPVEYVPIPESLQVRQIRKSLTASLLGGVNLGGLEDSGARVLASLNARSAEDVLAFEDRLRDTGIVYAVTRSPIWSNNGYSMQFVFTAAEDDAKSDWHPSEFRVLHEIERIQHPMVSVSKVEDTGDTYIATLDVIGSESTEMILKRLHLTTAMFSDIEVLDDTPHASARNLRVVRLGLRLQ